MRRWSRTTLRTRLVVGLLLLTSAAFVVVGVATSVALRGYLLRRVDAAVLQAVNITGVRNLGPTQDGDDSGGRDGDGDQARLEAEEVARATRLWDLTVRLSGAGASVVIYRSDGDETAGPVDLLSTADVAALRAVPPDGVPQTVVLSRAGGFRMIAIELEDGTSVVGGDSLDDTDETLRRLVLIELAAFAAVLVLVAVSGLVLVRWSLRPLRRVTQTAVRVSSLPLAAGSVRLDERVPDADPHTEVGQVATAFNDMLEHVESSLHERERSQAQLRRFVADAGHELRTPLAAIRGYAELFRRAGSAHPEQAAASADRIESAAGRMGLLVEDLLLLARLDENRPLEVVPLDLAEILAEAITEARAAGREHVWHLDVPADPVDVRGDPLRLHQVVANLLGNARVHTPPGTPVTARVRVQGEHAVIEVVDDGPGIPADVLPRVTERFTRADSSRSRASGGSGLGLSIAKAIVLAHGGTMAIECPPGGGTAVRVRLLLVPPRTKLANH